VVKGIWQKGCIAAAHGRFSGIRQMAPLCTLPNNAFLGPPEFTTQTVSRSVQPFLHSTRQSVDGHARACSFSLKLSLRMGRSGLPSNTWFLGSTRALNPNVISIGSSVFAGLITVTDRQTDGPTERPRYSVCNKLTTGHIYVRSTAMRPNENHSTVTITAV